MQKTAAGNAVSNAQILVLILQLTVKKQCEVEFQIGYV